MPEHLISPGLISQDANGDLVFDGVSWEEHVEAWTEVQSSLNEHFWALGAIGDSLARRYGDSDIQRFGREVGLSHQRIYALVKVYRGWRGKPKSARLSHSHHLEALKAPDPVEAIQAAEDDDMSTRQLAVWVAERAGRPPPEFPEVPEGGGSIVVPQDGSELRSWLSRVRSRKCLVGEDCAGPVEFAHLEAIPSSNYYGFVSRREGLGMWPGVPLCAHHHRTGPRSVHNIGESAFVEESLGGYKRAFGWIIRELVGFLMDSRATDAESR